MLRLNKLRSFISLIANNELLVLRDAVYYPLYKNFAQSENSREKNVLWQTQNVRLMEFLLQFFLKLSN